MRKWAWHLASGLALLATVVLLWRFELASELSLEGLKWRHVALVALADETLWTMVTTLFFAAHVPMAALSIPSAVAMTLAAGAVFGLIVEISRSSFASPIGATSGFSGLVVPAPRHRDRKVIATGVQSDGDRRREFDASFSRESANYLFTLRFVSAVPFFRRESAGSICWPPSTTPGSRSIRHAIPGLCLRGMGYGAQRHQQAVHLLRLRR